jgi:hypothetical protein
MLWCTDWTQSMRAGTVAVAILAWAASAASLESCLLAALPH